MKCLKNRVENYKVKKQVPQLSDFKPSSNKNVCFIVPHTEKAPGAFSHTLMKSEYQYMGEFIENKLKPACELKGLSVQVLRRDGRGIAKTYAEALKYKPFAILEIHFNAGGGHGFEVLYRPDLESERVLVNEVLDCMSRVLGTRNRGEKKKVSSGERGFVNVAQTSSVPSILLEPFFGDSSADSKNFHDKRTLFANELAAVLLKSFK